jgi:rubrerythrin
MVFKHRLQINMKRNEKMARPEIKTIQNLESAFAGESMAHIKYRYFAKLARAAGDIETAEIFEATADQEVMHALVFSKIADTLEVHEVHFQIIKYIITGDCCAPRVIICACICFAMNRSC